MARLSKKEQAKKDLADRLGLSEKDILTRKQVASAMGHSTTIDWIEKNLDASPPFYCKGHGHIALYPRKWVNEFLSTGKVMSDSGRLVGTQPWPPALPSRPPVDPVKRDRALSFLDELGVKVLPSMTDPAQIKKIEDYRRGVSEGIWTTTEVSSQTPSEIDRPESRKAEV